MVSWGFCNFFENPLQNTPKGYIIEIAKYPHRVF